MDVPRYIVNVRETQDGKRSFVYNNKNYYFGDVINSGSFGRALQLTDRDGNPVNVILKLIKKIEYDIFDRLAQLKRRTEVDDEISVQYKLFKDLMQLVPSIANAKLILFYKNRLITGVLMESITGGSVDQFLGFVDTLPTDKKLRTMETFIGHVKAMTKTMKSRGYHHNDLHSGNFLMRDKTGTNCVFIDFGYVLDGRNVDSFDLKGFGRIIGYDIAKDRRNTGLIEAMYHNELLPVWMDDESNPDFLMFCITVLYILKIYGYEMRRPMRTYLAKNFPLKPLFTNPNLTRSNLPLHTWLFATIRLIEQTTGTTIDNVDEENIYNVVAGAWLIAHWRAVSFLYFYYSRNLSPASTTRYRLPQDVVDLSGVNLGIIPDDDPHFGDLG